jgi:kinetochore protein Mis13/DSN1
MYSVTDLPHNSVSDSSFYKHIDVDLPDSERIRQLLIWSSLRASATPTSSTSQPSSSSSQPPPPPLPPLSGKAVQVLKSIQADVVKMLAEKRIDLSLYSPEAASSSKTKVEDLIANEQNVRNRHWEVTYSDHIKQSVSIQFVLGEVLSFTYCQYRSDAENEAWKEVGFKYKAYGERLQASLQERTAALYKLDESIPPETRHADETEAELDKRLGSALEFKIDQISSFINAARVTTHIAEKALNERFDIIASNLKSRLNPHPPPSDSSQMLTTYNINPRSTAIPDPLALMRALTRVDKERPPGMVTDAAWKAAREVQRVGESGVGAVGPRRLTGVPVTPKKMPGTPRRGNTPGTDR